MEVAFTRCALQIVSRRYKNQVNQSYPEKVIAFCFLVQVRKNC